MTRRHPLLAGGASLAAFASVARTTSISIAAALTHWQVYGSRAAGTALTTTDAMAR